MSARTSSFAPRLRLALLAGDRSGVRGIGSASARRSDGYEFAELRGYVEGDDPRRIDWAATARAGGLQTRVVLEDRALQLAVAIDASRSMAVGRTRSCYELARDAARVWFAVATDEDRCARIGERPLILREVRGRAAARACVEHDDAPGGAFAPVLRLALATLPRGTRMLVVSDFYDLDDAIRASLRACASRFVLATLVARDPWFENLPLGGFVRLRDAESGTAARVFIDRAARERYRAAVALRERTTCETLRRIGAHVALLDERDGAEHALARAMGIGA